MARKGEKLTARINVSKGKTAKLGKKYSMNEWREKGGKLTARINFSKGKTADAL